MTVSSIATAQCSPNPTESNQQTNCEGVEASPLIVATNGASVMVRQGAVISAAENASIVITSATSLAGTYVNTSSTVVVDGTITNASGRGIVVTTSANDQYSGYYHATSSSITVGGSGTITAPVGIDLAANPNDYYARVSVNLENNGLISSSTGGYALRGSSDATARFESILNSETGTIGAISGQVGSLINRGLIDGGTLSAYADASGSLQYFGQGTVSNIGTIRSSGSSATLYFTRAFNPGYFVENSGTISNSGSGPAVAGLTWLTLLNSSGGTISSNGTAISASSFLSVQNEGVIKGATGALTSDGTINLVNRGTINGDVRSGSTNPYAGSVIDNIGGTINGSVLLGDGNDIFIGDTANFTNPIGAITGTLDAGGGVDTLQFRFSEDTLLDSAIPLPQSIERLTLRIGGSSTLTLSGNFNAPYGLGIGGGDEGYYNIENQFINDGTITASSAGLVSDGVGGIGVTNNGTIKAVLAEPASFAVELGQISSFDNNGTITAAGGNGVRIFGADEHWQNSGTITADGTAVFASQSIVNTGTIRSVDGIGLDLSGAFRRSSLNSGTIEGGSAGARVYYSDLVNEGSILSPVAGIEIGIGGRVVNLSTGRISGGVAPSTQGFVTQGALVLNAGIIDGDVDFGTPQFSQATSNIFAALPDGIVNGNVHLGGGNDVFATSLINTGPGEFAGITGTVSGSGRETLRYIVDADAAAIPELRGIFSALAYDLSNDANLLLVASNLQPSSIGFSGVGKVDLTADLTGSGDSVVLDLRQTSIQSGEDGTSLPTKVDVTSRGTITVRREGASTYALPAVALASESSFTNAGTIVVQDAVQDNYYGAPTAILANGNASVINTGIISLDGAVGISGDSPYGQIAVDNQGAIIQGTGEGLSRGIVNASSVKNSGRISTAGSAVEFVVGSLINSGVIESSAGQAVLGTGYGPTRILNSVGGEISGGSGFDAISLAASIVSNAGTISGNVNLGYDRYGYGYSYGNSAYVDRGGTLNGDLIFGSGNDLFVSMASAIGVTGTIDAGAGVDTFIRSYGVDTTVDLGAVAPAPTGFERQGIGSSGTNTVVTLVGGSGALTTPLTLIGDGTIINTSNVAAAPLSAPPRVVTLGTQIDPLNVTGVGSTLSFVNRATLGNGVTGYARSFTNEGTINSGRLDVTSVSLLASDPAGFAFSNAGLISAAERAPFYNYRPIGVTIDNADQATSLAEANVANSGTIAGGIAIQLKVQQLAFDNSGTITRSNPSDPSVFISTRPPYGSVDATEFNGDSVRVSNSGTIRTGLNVDGVAKTLAFTNGGTIGSTSSAASIFLVQNGRQTVDPNFGYSVVDQDTATLSNSGTIYGTANLFSVAKMVNFVNSGAILLDNSAADEFSRIGGTSLSLEISTQESQSVNLSNSGTISTTHLGSGALLVAGYTLDGEYGYDENGEAATPVQGAPTSTMTINNAGTIRADGGALYQPATLSPFPWYPDSSEYVQPNIALTVTGASLGGADISVTNEAGGVVSAIGITRLFDGTDAAIPSAFETIGSTAFVASANTVSLVNAGTIQGLSGGIVPTGVSIELDSADYDYSDRYMAGAIQTFASVDTITNTKSGVIIGSVDLGTMNDSLVNFGTVNGDIFLRGGNDSMIQNIGGVLNGVADGGAGTDALLLDITGGGLLNQATLDKFVNFETTTITGTGTVTTSGPFTADSLVLRDANLTLAAGNILETASDVALIFAGGTNSLLNLGTIKGSIVTSAATTRIVNQGQISGPLTLGDGDDELTIGSGASFTGPVNAGAGNDILIISGGGSDAAPLELALSPFTGFERLLQDSGTVSMSGAFTTGIFDLVGGRFIGRAGSAFTADRINVAQGTTFGSAGTVNGNIVVQGILSPGSSPGTMTVNGSVALAGGSTTLFEMTPTVSDAVIINGALSIASGTTLKIVGERPLTPGLTYSLITASGGITGAFTTTDKASTVMGFLRQTANSIDLLGQFVLAPGSNPQVVRSVDYVNGLLLGGSAPSGVISAIPSLLTANGTANPAAFARLNAEPYAAASQIGIENGLAVAAALRSANMASQAGAPGLFSFGQALGGWRRLPGTTSAGTSRADISTQGLLAGIGLSSGALSIGGFVGYIDARQHIGPLGSKTNADGLLAGVVGEAALGGWEVAASLTYDGSSADTDRTLVGGAKTSAHYRLRGWTGDVSVGHAFRFGNGWSLRPEVGFTHISSRRGSAAETGGGALSLDVDGRRTKASFISGAFTLKGEPSAAIRPWLSAGLRHQLDGDAVYASAGLTGVSARLEVPGAARDRTLATIGAGASAQVAPGTSVLAGINSEFGADSSGESANVGLRVQF